MVASLDAGFESLPAELHPVLLQAQKQNGISVMPLEKLHGGRSGASIYLVSVSESGSDHVEHHILKLNRKGSWPSEEIDRHSLAYDEAPPSFTKSHMPRLAFEPVSLQDSEAIFYTIAGASLHNYRTIDSYKAQNHLEAIFKMASKALLVDWNTDVGFEQARTPQSLLTQWLSYRLEPGSRTEEFLADVAGVDPNSPGLLVNGEVLPNPFAYARSANLWGSVRHLDALVGSQHGDLNLRNILVKFSTEGPAIEGYYIIDFAMYSARTPLLFDLTYLELSYLIGYLPGVSLINWVDLALGYATAANPEPNQAPSELAGASAVIAAGRKSLVNWIATTHPSLVDDIWGQYWLAAVAAGLNFCNKTALSDGRRLAALIYSASHLKRFASAFGVPMPEDAVYLYSADRTTTPEGLFDFPYPRSKALSRHNLPSRRLAFVGREEEIEELRTLLASENGRLVTLTGPGGVGKTSLAIEVGYQEAENFEHGVLFVSLAPLTSAHEIARAAIEALSLSTTSGDDPTAELLRFLGGKQILLILDNFEHLLDGALLVGEILDHSPDVSVLATSRERLSLQGEMLYGLTGLDFAVWDSSEEALQYSCAQLFVEHARRISSDFELLDDDVKHIARICELAEGLPLAIVLSAAWIDVLSPAEIAAELGKSLDFLETRLRDLPARQRSLRAVFDTTWERLDTPEQNLFKQLSIFRGGFTRKAAEAVTGASLRDLATLVSKSLLNRDPETGRYEAHEVLRQYARESLDADPSESRTALDRHVAYFADFAQDMSISLRGDFKDHPDLEMERDIFNLRAAFRHAASQGHLENIESFVDALWFFHELRSWNISGLELFSEVATELEQQPDSAEFRVLKAWLLGARAYFTAVLGSPADAVEMSQISASELRRHETEGRKLLLPLDAMNTANIVLSQAEDISKTSKEAVEIAKVLGDQWWKGLFTTGLGSANALQGKPDEADRYAREGLKIFEEYGSAYGITFPLLLLARLAFDQEDYIEAEKQFAAVLATAQDINFDRGAVLALGALGNVNYQLQDLGQAEQYFLEALSLSNETGMVAFTLGTLSDLARTRAAAGGAREAVQILAVVLHHAAKDQHPYLRSTSVAEDAEIVRGWIEAQLSEAEFAALWAEGGKRDLDLVIAELLSRSHTGKGD